jgi:hypothetical protein
MIKLLDRICAYAGVVSFYLSVGENPDWRFPVLNWIRFAIETWFDKDGTSAEFEQIMTRWVNFKQRKEVDITIDWEELCKD